MIEDIYSSLNQRRADRVNERYNEAIREHFEDEFYSDDPIRLKASLSALEMDSRVEMDECGGSLKLEFDTKILLDKLDSDIAAIERRRQDASSRWAAWLNETIDSLASGEMRRADVLPPSQEVMDEWQEHAEWIESQLKDNGYDCLFSYNEDLSSPYVIAWRDNEFELFSVRMAAGDEDGPVAEIDKTATMAELVGSVMHEYPTEDDENFFSGGIEVSDSQHDGCNEIAYAVVTHSTGGSYEVAYFGMRYQESVGEGVQFTSLSDRIRTFSELAKDGKDRQILKNWKLYKEEELSWLLSGDSEWEATFNIDELPVLQGLYISIISLELSMREFCDAYIGYESEHGILFVSSRLPSAMNSLNKDMELRLFVRPISSSTPLHECLAMTSACTRAIAFGSGTDEELRRKDVEAFGNVTVIDSFEKEGHGFTSYLQRGFAVYNEFRFALTCMHVVYDQGMSPGQFAQANKTAEKRIEDGLVDRGNINRDIETNFFTALEQYRSDSGPMLGEMGSNMDSMSGVEFENLCKRLVSKMGFETQTTRASGDGGIDIVAYNRQPLISGKYVIQCKRYSGNVGEPILRDLYGVVMAERANKGILMTTAGFTRQAVAFSEEKQIELIDGAKLRSLLEQYGLLDGKRTDDAVNVLEELLNALEKAFIDINNINDDGDYVFGHDDETVIFGFEQEIARFILWVLEAGLDVTPEDERCFRTIARYNFDAEEIRERMHDGETVPWDFDTTPPVMANAFGSALEQIGADDPYEGITNFYGNLGRLLASYDETFGEEKLARTNEFISMIG